MHVTFRAAPALIVLALAGCSGGGNPNSSQADKVKPDLPRVTVEVKGMT